MKVTVTVEVNVQSENDVHSDEQLKASAKSFVNEALTFAMDRGVPYDDCASDESVIGVVTFAIKSVE